MPELIKLYRAPWHVTGDGIKSADGVWIMSTTSMRLAHQIVELANFADIHAGEQEGQPNA